MQQRLHLVDFFLFSAGKIVILYCHETIKEAATDQQESLRNVIGESLAVKGRLDFKDCARVLDFSLKVSPPRLALLRFSSRILLLSEREGWAVHGGGLK